MTHPKIIKADRDAAAKFFRDAWHLFWPGDFAKAMEQAKEIQDGYCDNWPLVETFARHRLSHGDLERAAKIAEAHGSEIAFGGEGDWYGGYRQACAHIAAAIRAPKGD